MNKIENLNIVIKALKEGNRRVFENVYSEFYEKLCVFLMGYTDDIEVIEDVVQDVFLKIWLNRKNISITTSLSSYLYKMAYTTLMENYRQLKRNDKMLSMYYYTAMMEAIETNQDLKNIKLKKLEKCINKLPDRCKSVFYENKINGYKYKVVADKMNISIKTVEAHISRALGFLKKCLV
ncbi:RNA polymerase sigma factor [Algibacter pacificus]|uniref:RNA polymerase sigma factor n=1 Tax=Algibacter pacificus TaxID=2599389 RepID=UPI001FE41269|nr:sigma-70 family RNA polymerase sigma factor [Algibacter pacificus]